MIGVKPLDKGLHGYKIWVYLFSVWSLCAPLSILHGFLWDLTVGLFFIFQYLAARYVILQIFKGILLLKYTKKDYGETVF